MVEPAIARAQIESLARRTGMTPEEVALVRAVPLFAGLPLASLATLLVEARVREHKRGALLFLQGDPADRFFVVLDGWVRLYRETAEGAEITIALFARGESFAEAAMLGPGRYPVSGVVAEPARLLHVPATSFWVRSRPIVRCAATSSLHSRVGCTRSCARSDRSRAARPPSGSPASSPSSARVAAPP